MTLNRPIDYEKLGLKQAAVQVTAASSTFPYRSAVATVTFNVTDVNDNTPRFLQQVRSVNDMGCLDAAADMFVICVILVTYRATTS